jgi:hypothetical protein
VCISPFLRFSVFLAIFQVIQMFVTHFPRFYFCFLTIFQVLQFVFLIFLVFQCFSSIFHVLNCVL